ncbi:MAG: NADH-quinone oxidoreductase subunit C [Verrucomicrobiales bacterium]
MEPLEQILTRIESSLPGVSLRRVANESPSAQVSLLVEARHLVEVCRFLRDTPGLEFDYASNVTGVDWPERVDKAKTKVKALVEGVEKEVEEMVETRSGGYLEVVYHLFSMKLKHGPLILRARTRNRTSEVSLPSVTGIWKGCEFQEREIFDLYGVVFDGHPDLRRILLPSDFDGHALRKDYPLRGYEPYSMN